MRKQQKRIIERLVGKVDEEEIDIIKISPLSYIKSDDWEILDKIVHNETEAKIKFDSEKLNEAEEQLFKIILINNNIDEEFKGMLEIYEF